VSIEVNAPLLIGARTLAGAGPAGEPPGPGPARMLGWLAGGLLVALCLLLMPLLLIAIAVHQGAGGSCIQGQDAAGAFAAIPLLPGGGGREVIASQFGGPSDPNTGTIGYRGDDLLAHPDSYAELDMGSALGGLPYLTPLRVTYRQQSTVLLKRSIGLGGRGLDGLPRAVDLWWQAARALSFPGLAPVRVQRLPDPGAGNLLAQTPLTPAAQTRAGGCPSPLPLALTGGELAQILPGGTAAAPADAPAAVKAAIAAGNLIHTTPYLYGGGHGQSLDTIAAAYDCSSSVSFLLHRAGLLDANPRDSIELETFGLLGPGRWITVYANSAHAFMAIAGIGFDTADYGGPDIPPGSGPRWRAQPTANLTDGTPYVARHPPGL
jgi:hypothetical protein